MTHLGSGGTRNLAETYTLLTTSHSLAYGKSLHPGSLGVGVHHPHN